MTSTENLWQEVKENHAKLYNCPKHKFPEMTKVMAISNKLIICENCGGGMRSIDIQKYCRGYKAAGGNPDDICKGVL